MYEMQAKKLFQEGQDFHRRGRRQEALQRYERALKIDPKMYMARLFKAVSLLEMGRPHEAVIEAEVAHRAMEIPDPAFLVNYGVILKNVGRLDEAANVYEQALSLNPNIPSAQANLATVYFLQGRLEEAELRFKELTSTMEDPAPWLNLARIAFLKEQHDLCSEYLEKATDLDPTHPDVALLSARLAIVDADYSKAYKKAITALKRAPAHRDSWMLLQSIDHEHFNFSEINGLLSVLANSKVQSATVLSIAVDFCRKYWLWDHLTALEEMLSDALITGLDRVPTTADIFTLLGANITQRAHLAAASKCWDEFSRVQRLPVRRDDYHSNEKLKIAFLSSDLRGHAIGYLIVGLFENLRHDRFEWWAYSNTFSDNSDVRERLRDNFDRFVNIAKMNDVELAAKIRSDRIDIVIDLNQMTSGTRAGVFAYRPAPIQIQWLGMPGTLGAGDDVDYIIVDPWVIDDENRDGFSEKFLVLPRSYQPNDHVPPNLNLCPTRSDAGLPEKGTVFGVFNQYYKFSPDTAALWGRIFSEVDDAILWLLKPTTEELKDRILDQLDKYGVARERIYFAEHKPQAEHLARLRWMDLVLDTWPYNAHTTCSDALRAGVPVLTFPQKTFASRVAAGILHTAGLDEWVAQSADEYVAKAVSFGNMSRDDKDKIKSRTHQDYWASPMVDNKRLGQYLELYLQRIASDIIDKNLPPVSLRMNRDGEIYSFDDQSSNGLQVPDTSRITKTVSNAIRSDNHQSKLSSWEDEIIRSGPKARYSNLRILSNTVIRLSEKPLVLDIGAAPEGNAGYERFADENLIRIIGFEPDNATYSILTNTQSLNKSYLPYALGDGESHTLHICKASGMNSLLVPDTEWLSLFPGFAEWGRVHATEELYSHRLDDINEAKHARFIKMDVQGFELNILKHSINTLQNVAMLQIEASPTPIYKNEPTFFEVGQWLYDNGFVLHTLSNQNKRAFKPFGNDENPFSAVKQIFQLDAVFIPNPLSWQKLDTERLLSLAFFAHTIYQSFDVSMRALLIVDERIKGNRVEQYRKYLSLAGLAA